MTTAMPKSPKCARQGGALKLHRDCGFGEVSNATFSACVARTNATFSASWHEPCHNTYITRARDSGDAHHFASGTGSGGARNRADRESYALTTAQIGNLMASERHAARIGLPFTRMFSIHWEAAGVPLVDMAKATGHFTDLLGKALARHGSATAWLWVHESGNRKGGHCHLLAHVPAELVSRVIALQRGWLRIITGRSYRPRVIHSRPIGKTCNTYRSNPADYFPNAKKALAYILKGASPDAASKFGLERLEPGGRIIGRRCSTSQNISAKARKTKD